MAFFRLNGKQEFLINADRIDFIEKKNDGVVIHFNAHRTITVSGEGVDDFDVITEKICELQNP